jgi:hypothetical protein
MTRKPMRRLKWMFVPVLVTAAAPLVTFRIEVGSRL